MHLMDIYLHTCQMIEDETLFEFKSSQRPRDLQWLFLPSPIYCQNFLIYTVDNIFLYTFNENTQYF